MRSRAKCRPHFCNASVSELARSLLTHLATSLTLTVSGQEYRSTRNLANNGRARSIYSSRSHAIEPKVKRLNDAMLDCLANATDSCTAVGVSDFLGCASSVAISDCRACAGVAHCVVLGCADSFTSGTLRQECNWTASSRDSGRGARIWLGIRLVSRQLLLDLRDDAPLWRHR